MFHPWTIMKWEYQVCLLRAFKTTHCREIKGFVWIIIISRPSFTQFKFVARWKWCDVRVRESAIWCRFLSSNWRTWTTSIYSYYGSFNSILQGTAVVVVVVYTRVETKIPSQVPSMIPVSWYQNKMFQSFIRGIITAIILNASDFLFQSNK